MGKVRFYSEDGETYITVRAEELSVGNKHVFHVKLRKRRHVPYSAQKTVRSKPLSIEQTLANTPEALSKVVAALKDIQEGVETGLYQSVIIGTAFKSDELQLSINLGKSKWKNIPGDNYLDCLINYCDDLELLPLETPPPTPLRGGKGS